MNNWHENENNFTQEDAVNITYSLTTQKYTRGM